MQILDYKNFPRNISHDKIIVCDVDDTICTTRNRDYSNSEPKTEMIEKLNALYDMGYGIVYFTARGQHSCNGELDLIEQERRPILESWLNKHGVKYDVLLFSKPLAALYIDDKAVNPETFLTMPFEELKGGSGSKIYREGSRVVKTCKNAVDQEEWYKVFNGLNHPKCIKAPEVHSRVVDTLYMDYVGEKEPWDFEACEIALSLRKYFDWARNAEPMYDSDFQTYIDRVNEHLTLFSDPVLAGEIQGLLSENLDDFNRYRSFCHGDLTLSNIRISEDYSHNEFDSCYSDMLIPTLHLIDPNCPKGVYSSFLLDLGKLMQSIVYEYEYKFGITSERLDLKWHFVLPYISSFIEDPKEIALIDKLSKIACLTHFVRMRKYKKTEAEKAMVDEIIRSNLKAIREEQEFEHATSV